MKALSLPLPLLCGDGIWISASLYEGQGSGITLIVLPAMMTRTRFYRRFSEHMAAHGVRVLVVCHRGMGESLEPSGEVRLRDWGEQDLPAAIAWARSTRPQDRLMVMGHSMGGQIVTLPAQVHELDAILTMGATLAWFGHWPSPERQGIRAWYWMAPVIARVLRHRWPLERLGLGPDIRPELVRTWARWGRDPDYLWGRRFGLAPHASEYRGRVLAISASDDRLGSEQAVRALHQRFQSAQVEHWVLTDGGHFGYFQRRPDLWDRTLAWMAQAPAQVGSSSPR